MSERRSERRINPAVRRRPGERGNVDVHGAVSDWLGEGGYELLQVRELGEKVLQSAIDEYIYKGDSRVRTGNSSRHSSKIGIACPTASSKLSTSSQ